MLTPSIIAATPKSAAPWRPIESAPRDGTRVLVWFLGAGAIAAYREEEHPDQWVRYLGFGKSTYWPTIHAVLATHWTPLPSPPGEAASPATGSVQATDEP